ncbi:MAG: family 43 glycosylhydrolase [Muribaculaceae bacterium]|nr:family 43 glycosylhydrolase [Muribaculaceae bacterium]
MNKTLVTLLLAVCHAVAAMALVGESLLLPGDYPDPSIVRDGDDYYMTHSPFCYMPGFLIWHSTDLRHWEPLCRALLETNGDLWAPDLVKCNGRYYIYYPAGGTNYVLHADRITGPWQGPIDLHVGGIDPGHIQTADGTRYLYTSGGNVVQLAPDGLSTVGEMRQVYEGWAYPQDWETECFCLEAPKLTYHDGWFYLTSAQGGTAGPATSHMVVTARSKSPCGPWENSPYNPIVHTSDSRDTWWSRGHGTIFDDSTGQWWMVYHAYRKDYHTLGRQTLIVPIEWTADGWPRTCTRHDEPFTPQHPDPSDDFTVHHLGWQWMFWKEYAPQALHWRKGGLDIDGKGGNTTDGRMLLVNATDTCYEVTVDVTPRRGATGGLLLYYNEKAHAGITVSGQEATIIFNGSTVSRERLPHHRHCALRIRNERGRAQMAVSLDGRKTWQVLTDDLDVSSLHHNRYGQFISLRVALLAAGAASTHYAHFHYHAR